jgi:hypothetical protein
MASLVNGRFEEFGGNLMYATKHEESFIENFRRRIEQEYLYHPTGCGGSFGELLCWEIHSNNKTFLGLSEKWGIPVTIVGELIYDHCKRLENLPKVKHESS